MQDLILTKNSEGIEFYLSQQYTAQDLKRCQEKSLQMMSVIVDIFEKHKVDYVLAHGTLLGLIRHGGFIPWDDDCDLFVFDWDYARAIELLRRYLPEDMIVHNRRTDPIYWPKWTKVRDLYSDTYESLWKIDRKFRFHGICVDILKVTVMEKGVYHRGKKIADLNKKIRKRNRTFLEKRLIEKMRAIPRFIAGSLRDNIKKWIFQMLAGLQRQKVCVGNKDTIIECTFPYDAVFPVEKSVFEGFEVAIPKRPEDVLKSMYGEYMRMPNLEERKPHFERVVFCDSLQGSEE